MKSSQFKHSVKQRNTQPPYAKQRGFTLIELITVVIIIGILSAMALPRFIGLRTEAIIASMHGVDAAIESATTMAFAKAAVNGVEQQPTATIDVDGETIDMVYGYPAGTANGIAKLITAPTGDWKQRASSFSGAWVYWHGVINEDAGAAGCYVRYRQATSAGARPVVDNVRGGCATAE